MGPTIDPIETDAVLPERADIVIIGGGIIGTSAALFLAERGHSVVLCEKGVIAGEQSSRNWGWCRKTVRDPHEIPLIIEAIRLWEGMNRRVGAETGFRTTGGTYVADRDEQVSRMEGWLVHARDYQLDSRFVSGAELVALLPETARPAKGAIHTPSDGCAEPQKAAPAIIAAARQLGATVITGCAVRGIETTGGRVSAAVTERGRIACESVVLAGGAWSSRFCRSLGIRLPQLDVRASVMRTVPFDGPGSGNVWTSDGAFRKRLDGGYTIAKSGAVVADVVPASFRYFFDFMPAVQMEFGALSFRFGKRFVDEIQMPTRISHDRPSPFERHRMNDPDPITRINQTTREKLAARFPIFEGVATAQEWGGLIDVTPDAVPVISKVDEIPGFVIATGFSGHGFGIGPGAGHLVADLVTGDPTVVDATPFRLSRFGDGSNPRPRTYV